MTIQTANELRYKLKLLKDVSSKDYDKVRLLNQARDNLEKIGCSLCHLEFAPMFIPKTGCSMGKSRIIIKHLCPDCQQAKEIYEEILK